MKRIKRECVNRILDAADIVEVVSDFVTLRRRGANYVGLCPFHSERTPSFSVSKSRGYCKCFSCGKGGSPVGFLMELNNLSYQEALRCLAKKYNIPIEEDEETKEEQNERELRESLFRLNEFALAHFEKNLYETEEGRNIGLAYFTERGIRPETIKKFNLGYALERNDTLGKDSVKAGFSEELLDGAGLCIKPDRGDMYNRFRGRVIYPVFSRSGQVVAFGGRTLRKDKNVAKYVNSPETAIYSKSKELYGLRQAGRAIQRADKCILVEGYMDVLSMSQSGVENVVASSGTSLTEQQIKLIKGYTNNITVIYDADAAGIKASLRGINMILAHDMNVKVVLFPEGEDPDSFAQSHTVEELNRYLAENETDFITFKATVLLKDAGTDPAKRSQAIYDTLESIAIIPNPITRQVYIELCASTFNMDASILAPEVNKIINENKSKKSYSKDLAQNGQESSPVKSDDKAVNDVAPEADNKSAATPAEVVNSINEKLVPYEKALLKYIVSYGMHAFTEGYDSDGNPTPITVLDYVKYEMERLNFEFTHPLYAEILNIVSEMAENWDETYYVLDKIKNEEKRLLDEGLERIRHSGGTVDQIMFAETILRKDIAEKINYLAKEKRKEFFSKQLFNDARVEIRSLVLDLIDEKHQLSKIHSKVAYIPTEEERLTELVPRAIFELKDAKMRIQIDELNKKIDEAAKNSEEVVNLMKDLMDLIEKHRKLAFYLGDRIIMPKI